MSICCDWWGCGKREGERGTERWSYREVNRDRDAETEIHANERHPGGVSETGREEELETEKAEQLSGDSDQKAEGTS